MENNFQKNRRLLLGSMLTMPMLASGCFSYGRYFDIEWDEEVELHNGEVIIVHIKRTFERVKHMRYEKWKGMKESIEISFDAGGSIGVYKRKFVGYDIRYINKSNNIWYLKLIGQEGFFEEKGVKRVVDRNYPILMIFPSGEERAARSWEEVPFFPKNNLLRVLPDSEYISRFNGKMVTLAVKEDHSRKYPTGKIINANGVQPQPE